MLQLGKYLTRPRSTRPRVKNKQTSRFDSSPAKATPTLSAVAYYIQIFSNNPKTISRRLTKDFKLKSYRSVCKPQLNAMNNFCFYLNGEDCMSFKKWYTCHFVAIFDLSFMSNVQCTCVCVCVCVCDSGYMLLIVCWNNWQFAVLPFYKLQFFNPWRLPNQFDYNNCNIDGTCSRINNSDWKNILLKYLILWSNKNLHVSIHENRSGLRYVQFFPI